MGSEMRSELSSGAGVTEDDVRGVWAHVIQIITENPDVPPYMVGQLTLAVPRGIGGGAIYLAVQHEFTLQIFESRLRPIIMAAIATLPEAAEIETFIAIVDADAKPDFDFDDAADEPTPQAEPEVINDFAFPDTISQRQAQSAPFGRHADASGISESQLNEKYRFDSFVIGQSNRFAHAAAFAVAEAPAKAYNPLFIYGDSGLGKTHLLHAIGHYSKELFTGVRVRYVSSEDFTNDFINSIANNQGSKFHAKYRSVDILLIDDIQFLRGKAETQEAFFHTFNTLHDHNKQVVITSDVQPKHLTGFEERMLSRFEWGLLTDIQVPDLETRIAILRKKAQREKLHVPDEILEFIATKFTSNIRELEGTLIRVTAFASLNQQTIDMALVQTVLKDLITLDEDNEIQPTDIISVTADYFSLGVDDLYGSSRAQQIATARQIAMYLCRDLTDLSLPKIGQLFGGRDHTTVMYSYKKISQLIAERRSIYNQVTELTTRIKQRSR
jgi:chromosomal replication initiator protein